MIRLLTLPPSSWCWSARTYPRPPASNALDQGSGPEAAAAAHRHQPHLLVGALHLVQERRYEAGAGRAERVAEGDRPAVDVDPVHVRFELATPGADDRGEGLVDLAEVDVVHLHPGALAQLPRRRHRPGEHARGVDADVGLIEDPPPRLEAELVGFFAAHQQRRGGAVGDLG